METEYGTVRFIYETYDNMPIYVYEINDSTVKAAIMDGRPYLSLLRYSSNGRAFFKKLNKRVYIDELEELRVL